ncbi:hypothetical protein MMC30_001446 [Trapelia coarctata]|nr:hypothetical protein [Trapelia coarctata]
MSTEHVDKNPQETAETVSQEKSLRFHLETIWLFTANDIQSIVYPETAFGIFSALSGKLLTTNTSPDLLEVLSRVSRVVLWNWLNVLLFDVANQRLPTSIIEDSVNKGWRPLPSQRLSEADTRRLLLTIVPLVFVASLYLGGMEEAVAMMVLTWMYNDLGGADENYLVRNLINAFGFICYSSGATIVAAGYRQHALNNTAYSWLAIIAGIIFTTLQMQDMADMEGDAVRGRRTLPLVHGEGIARWSIALPVMFWSVVCPAFWGLHVAGYTASLAVGAVLAFRVLMFRTVAADKLTWKVWCLWTSILYLLPLFKDHSVFDRFLGSYQG